MNILTAIPVYNEERHLAAVLEEVRRFARHILVVNDGSTDRTAELLAAEKDLCIVTHRQNRGYGAALMSAFAFALDHRVDVLGGEKSRAAQVTRLEKAQLLQENRSLAPRAALGDRPPFEVGRHGRLMARCISREVVGGEETRMRESRAVHDL